MTVPTAIRDAPRMLRRAPRILRNLVRDLRYGAPLGGTIKTRHGHLGAHDIGNADYDGLTRLFAEIDVAPDDVIVDIGSGKGRAINWFLAHHPHHRIYGIELDAEVCARTAKRLRRFPNVELLCGDATELLPADGTLLYLFNPFGEDVMRQFAAAVLQLAPREDGRARRLVYYNRKFLEPFLEEPRFTVRELEPAGTFKSALIEVR